MAELVGFRPVAVVSSPYLRAMRALADEFDGGTVIVGGHGTFICRALAGFGFPVDLAFSRAMPMPAVYRLVLSGRAIDATGPGV